MPSNIRNVGYVSARRLGRSMPCARAVDHASSTKRRSPGSWTARIGSVPCSVGPSQRKSAVCLERRPDPLGAFGHLVGRDDAAHHGLGHDIVGEVCRAVDDAHAGLLHPDRATAGTGRRAWRQPSDRGSRPSPRRGDSGAGCGPAPGRRRTSARPFRPVRPSRTKPVPTRRPACAAGPRRPARRRAAGRRPGDRRTSCRSQRRGHEAAWPARAVRPASRRPTPGLPVPGRRPMSPGPNRDGRRGTQPIERITSGGSSRPRRNSSTSIPVAVERCSSPPSTSTSRTQRGPSTAAAAAATIAPNPWPTRVTRSSGARAAPSPPPPRRHRRRGRRARTRRGPSGRPTVHGRAGPSPRRAGRPRDGVRPAPRATRSPRDRGSGARPARRPRPSRGSGSDRPARRPPRTRPARRRQRVERGSAPGYDTAPMPKRRRGSRTAPSRAVDRHAPFERLVERALAGIPSPFREALAEVAIVIDDEPTAQQRRDNDLGPDDGPLRPVRRRPADRLRRRLGRPAQPDHPVPPAARGRLRRSLGPRRGGPDHGHPRAGPPPRHRRRSARRAGRSDAGPIARCGGRDADANRPTEATVRTASAARTSHMPTVIKGRPAASPAVGTTARTRVDRPWPAPPCVRAAQPAIRHDLGRDAQGGDRHRQRPDRGNADGHDRGQLDHSHQPAAVLADPQPDRDPGEDVGAGPDRERREQAGRGVHDADDEGESPAPPGQTDRGPDRLERAEPSDHDRRADVGERQRDQELDRGLRPNEVAARSCWEGRSRRSAAGSWSRSPPRCARANTRRQNERRAAASANRRRRATRRGLVVDDRDREVLDVDGDHGAPPTHR